MLQNANSVKNDKMDNVNNKEHWQKLLEDIDPTGELQERAKIAQDISMEESSDEENRGIGIDLGQDPAQSAYGTLQDPEVYLGGGALPAPVGQYHPNF